MKTDGYKGKTITVIGGGISGRALAILGKKLGAQVFVTEQKAIPASTRFVFDRTDITYEENGHTDRAWQSDLVLASSGLSPEAFPVEEARKRGIPVKGELDFVAPFLKGRILAVTGSNGKTTTTSLMGHLLSECGFQTKTVGNIGSPIAEAAFQDTDFVVTELSSFQLHWMDNFPVDLAIMTNLAPDHIDWHGSFEKYVHSKIRLLNQVRSQGETIAQSRDLHWIKTQREGIISLTDVIENCDNGRHLVLNGQEILFFDGKKAPQRLFGYSDSPLLGQHNLENCAMAFLGCLLQNVDPHKLLSAMKTFVGPPHRCEPVRTYQGICFIDDSKGTNVAATVTALNSLPGRKIVILGGQGKGEDYTPLARAVKHNASAAIVIGIETPKICQALQKAGCDTILPTRDMETAVRQALLLARHGDTVLLSPACTSWDMYPNYKERGNHFQSLVQNLESL